MFVPVVVEVMLVFVDGDDLPWPRIAHIRRGQTMDARVFIAERFDSLQCLHAWARQIVVVKSTRQRCRCLFALTVDFVGGLAVRHKLQRQFVHL